VGSVEPTVERELAWETRQAAGQDRDMELLVDEIPAIISGKISKHAKRRYRQLEILGKPKVEESDGGVAGNNADGSGEGCVYSGGSDTDDDAENAVVVVEGCHAG